jgi:hypothetical protein
VLFSIGIIAVGLLGILVILPVAGSRTTRGTLADAADRVGRSAIREFNVQSMRRVNMWYGPTLNPALPQQLMGINGGAYCIDPLFIAKHITNGSVPTAAGCFPSIVPSTAQDTRIFRITLCSYPGSNSPMTTSRAEQVFLSHDDLQFDLPSDASQPATYIDTPSQSLLYQAAQVQRPFEGKLSWLATVAPKEISSNDEYLLSIVVFLRRDGEMSLPASTPSASEPDNERLVNVSFSDIQKNPTPTTVTLGDGLNGGDVLLETRDTTRDKTDLVVRTGDWIMLIGTKVVTLAGQSSSQYLRSFRWYRVQDIEPEPRPENSLWRRRVTLFGPDIDADLVKLVKQQPPAAILQAVLLNDVVAVYEKTIRLESTSLWTQ